jgi:Tfp pilus assembly protein PilP
MKTALLALAVLFAAACDDPPPPPPPKAGGGGAKAGAKPGGKKVVQLQARMHVEEKVNCPSPDKATGPACNKDAPDCDAGKTCLPVGTGFYCEACPERDSIRHEFKDRDFVPDQARDPFQSFIIRQKGLEAPVEKHEDLGPCRRQDQLVASNYSYLDMRLVGIVAQGTQRKVLMMDRGNLGHIIRRGDCVGKEKALVKDIGPGFVTFVIAPDENDKTPNRAPVEHSVQLNPKGLQVAPQPGDLTQESQAPIVPPGTAPAPAPAPAPTAPVVTP